MKLATTLVVLAHVAFLYGCTAADSVHPVYTESDLNNPVHEPKIEGEWMSSDPSMLKWKIGPFKWRIDPPKQTGHPNGAYSVELLRCPWPKSEKEGCGTNFAVRIVAIDDKLFFDAVTPADCTGLKCTHLVGRIWVQQDLLRIAFLDSKWVKKNSPPSFHDFVSIGKHEDNLITPSTQELRNFLVQNSDNGEAMADVYYLCRQQDECLARSFEDELRRSPADRAILEAAADFFLKRGDFDRAGELQGRRLDLNPEDLSWHARIGETLLLKRDFAGARREFTVLESYSPHDSSAQERIVWSYFLEGAYVDAVVAATNYHARKKQNSANPILLRYFSLLRLGRSDEAESFLKKQYAKFKGPKNERALLLQAQEHGPDASMVIAPPVDEVARRSMFFYALATIGRGDAVSAKAILEAALTQPAGEARNDNGPFPALAAIFRGELRTAVPKAPNDSFFALAARIELDRLSACRRRGP